MVTFLLLRCSAFFLALLIKLVLILSCLIFLYSALFLTLLLELVLILPFLLCLIELTFLLQLIMMPFLLEQSLALPFLLLTRVTDDRQALVTWLRGLTCRFARESDVAYEEVTVGHGMLTQVPVEVLVAHASGASWIVVGPGGGLDSQ